MIIMKNLSIKLACIFIIVMYCLAPLSALDLNQSDNNTKYSNQDDNTSKIEVKNESIPVDDSQREIVDDNSSDVKVKDDKKLASDDDKANGKFIDPDLHISIADIDVGERPVVEIFADDKFCGYVYLTTPDSCSFKEVYVKNGHATVTLNEKYNPGTYTVVATFYGNLKYKSSVAKTSFTVRKIDPCLSISVDDINKGESAIVNVNANEKLYGKV